MERMRSKLKMAVVIGLIIALNVLILPQVVKADSSNILPSGMVIGDSQGIQVKSDGKYLVDVRDVQPGKKWSTKITMLNLEEEIPYHLTMHISPPTLVTGSLDLSKAIQMRLVYEGQTVYQGSLSGISPSLNLQNELIPLDLGVFKGGDTRMLEVFFELDGEKYTNSDFLKKNVMENIWYFKAVKSTLPDTDGSENPSNTIKNIFRLPRTGEEWRDMLIFICIGLFLLLVALLILKHRVVEKKENRLKK